MSCVWPELIREIGVANIAHRGASAYAPENTLASLELAFEMRAHAVEFDVRLTRDGVPVLIHDETVDRTTDGEGTVRELDLEQIRSLDAGSWFSEEHTGLGIPTLAEALEVLPEDGLVNLELKGGWTDRELEGVLDAVAAANLAPRVVISSYEVETIRRVSSLSDVCGTSLRVRSLPDGQLDDESLVGVCQCVNLEARATSPRAVERLHELGFVVETYTVNEEEEMRRLVDLGVDAIFTDRPDLLARVLDERLTPRRGSSRDTP